MALDSTITSGTIPLCSTAQKAPVRPTPVCTSSAISGMDAGRGDLAHPAHPAVGGGVHAALALYRFEDHSGRRRHSALGIVQETLGPPRGDLGAPFAADTERAAVVLRKGKPGDPDVLGAARGREGSRRHPVVRTGEGEKPAAPGRGTDQLEGRFDRVRAGRPAELDPGVVGELRRECGEQLRGEGVLDRGCQVEDVQGRTRVDDVLDRFQNDRMVVPEGQRARSGETVEIASSVRAFDGQPAGPYRHDRQ